MAKKVSAINQVTTKIGSIDLQLEDLIRQNAPAEEAAKIASSFLLGELDKEENEIKIAYSAAAFKLQGEKEALESDLEDAKVRLEGHQNNVPILASEAGWPITPGETPSLEAFYDFEEVTPSIESAAVQSGLTEKVTEDQSLTTLGLAVSVASGTLQFLSISFLNRAIVIKFGRPVIENPAALIAAAIVGLVLGVFSSLIIHLLFQRVGYEKANREVNPKTPKSSAIGMAVGAFLLVVFGSTALEFSGLNEIVNGNARPEEKIAGIILGVIALLVTTVTYGGQAAIGGRKGYVERGYSAAVEKAEKVRGGNLKSDRFKFLYEALEDIDQLPLSIEKKKSEIAQIDADLKALKAAHSADLNRIKNAKANFMRNPAGNFSDWPLEAQSRWNALSLERRNLELQKAAFQAANDSKVTML